MKTEIRKYAECAAWEHFYSDEDIPWEPFEHYDEGWIDEQCDKLADSIEAAMLWALSQK